MPDTPNRRTQATNQEPIPVDRFRSPVQLAADHRIRGTLFGRPASPNNPFDLAAVNLGARDAGAGRRLNFGAAE